MNQEGGTERGERERKKERDGEGGRERDKESEFGGNVGITKCICLAESQ